MQSQDFSANAHCCALVPGQGRGNIPINIDGAHGTLETISAAQATGSTGRKTVATKSVLPDILK
jgi:hypothetical protein